MKKLNNDVELILAEKCVEECDEIIQSFLNKVKVDIKERETFNLMRRSPQATENLESVPNSYMNTITRFQEFFGLDSNGEPVNGTTNPFEFGPSPEEMDLRRLEDEDEDGSPDVRKSVMVRVEEVQEDY